jgi:diguanylate cyclase (GGDEF)-like protein
LNPATALVIDPEASHRAYLASALSAQGLEVYAAANAAQALELISRLSPNLIFLDEVVGGLTPRDLNREVQARAQDSFLIVMGRAEDLDRSMSWIMAGALAYLRKPVEYEQLKIAVETGLENQEAFREIMRLTQDLKMANKQLKRKEKLLLSEQKALSERTLQLHLLYELGAALSATYDPLVMVRRAAKTLARLFQARLVVTATAFVPDGPIALLSSQALAPALKESLARELMQKVRQDLALDPTGWCLKEPARSRPPLSVCPSRQITLPLTTAGKMQGLFTAYFDRDPDLTEDQRLLLESLAMQAAQALLNAHRHEMAVHLASRDHLTGLYNRRAFEEELSRQHHRTLRHGTVMSVLLLDIDHFKLVNDRHGHEAGDEALKAVAGLIAGAVRKVDLSARHGGEEFAAILPDTTRDQAVRLAKRIQNRLAQTMIRAGAAELRLTVSQGIADTREAGVHSAQDLVRAADEALYEAKARGRNMIVTSEALSLVSSRKGGPHV